MKIKYYIWTILITIIVGILIGAFFKKSGSSMAQFATGGPVKNVVANEDSDNVTPHVVNTQKPKVCPLPETLIKQDLRWSTPDGKWESYTPSSATKVLSFTGAQWIGIMVGKIICLYQTDEAVSFPVALEQTKSDTVLEPLGFGWSALVSGHKFCKSASVADCPYFLERPKDTSDIYQEIKYAPKKDDIQ